MIKELRGTPNSPPKPRIRRITQESLPVIDITQISATGFHFNLYRPENEVFSISLYEIDRLIEERAKLEDPRFSLDTRMNKEEPNLL